MNQRQPLNALEVVRAHFGSPAILVVGDLMLDRHLYGEVVRISPEAPVPVLRFAHQVEAVGGAGNAARNLARLGCQVAVAGAAGTDADGDALIASFASEGICVAAVIRVEDRSTTVKTRVIGGCQQMLRIDSEQRTPLDPPSASRLRLNVLDLLSQRNFKAVILSDYDKGVLDVELCQATIEACRLRGIPVFVDPKGASASKYRGATALTPNRSEFSVLAGVCGASHLPLVEAARRVVADLALDWILVTRSEEGMTLVTPTTHVDVAATAREVFDVSGAGDTVIATLTAALLAGLVPVDAVWLSNLAAGLVVSRVSTTPVQIADLELALLDLEPPLHSKICLDWNEAYRRVTDWKAAGETVVFTNGCFDLLHAGHVTFLERARREGSKLILAMNSDASVRRLKGRGRPYNKADDRCLVVAALSSVDAVVVFGEDTPLDLIRLLRPDVLAKGSDYSAAQVAGRDQVESWGGRLVLIPLLDGRSTSTSLARIGKIRVLEAVDLDAMDACDGS